MQCALANIAAGRGLPDMRTKIDANGTLIDFVAHGEDVYMIFFRGVKEDVEWDGGGRPEGKFYPTPVAQNFVLRQQFWPS